VIGGIFNGICNAPIELAKGIGRRLRQEVCLHVISYTVSDDFTIHLTLLGHVNCTVAAFRLFGLDAAYALATGRDDDRE
jgi:hypothetical protein